MILKIRAELAGAHYHTSFWMGTDFEHLGKCGELVFRDYEWQAFSNTLGFLGKKELPKTRPVKSIFLLRMGKFPELTVAIEEEYAITGE